MAFPLCQVSLCVSPVIHLSVVERPRDGMPGQFCVVHTLAPHSFYTNNFSPLPPSTFSSVQWEDGGGIRASGRHPEGQVHREARCFYAHCVLITLPSLSSSVVILCVCKTLPSPRQRILWRRGIYLMPLSLFRTQHTASCKMSIQCMFVCLFLLNTWVCLINICSWSAIHFPWRMQKSHSLSDIQ